MKIQSSHLLSVTGFIQFHVKSTNIACCRSRFMRSKWRSKSHSIKLKQKSRQYLLRAETLI